MTLFDRLYWLYLFLHHVGFNEGENSLFNTAFSGLKNWCNTYLVTLQLFEWQVLQNQPLTADLLQFHSWNYEPCILPTELAEQQISRKVPTLKSVYLYHHIIVNAAVYDLFFHSVFECCQVKWSNDDKHRCSFNINGLQCGKHTNAVRNKLKSWDFSMVWIFSVLSAELFSAYPLQTFSLVQQYLYRKKKKPVQLNTVFFFFQIHACEGK